MAGGGWGAEMLRMELPPARPGSWEFLLPRAWGERQDSFMNRI